MFAANFIGHYNILDTVAMKKVVPVDTGSEFVAIRPEAVHISVDGGGSDEAHTFDPGKRLRDTRSFSRVRNCKKRTWTVFQRGNQEVI